MVVIDNQENVKRIELILTAAEALAVSAAVRMWKEHTRHLSDKALCYSIIEKLYNPVIVEEQYVDCAMPQTIRVDRLGAICVQHKRNSV